ncbi:MAG: hypothetical protein E7478_02740 [Ruminococcaceae bacterium]|nr:hypothetical protein [Oscillospiraceae bacterium]
MFYDKYSLSPTIIYPVIAAFIVAMVIVPMDYKYIVGYVSVILGGIYCLIPIGVLVLYWKRIRREWTATTAVITRLYIGSREQGDHMRFVAEAVDEEGKKIPFSASTQWVMGASVGKTLRVVYDRKHPSDFLIVPAYRIEVACHLLFAAICFAAGILGIVFTLK